MVEIEKVQPLEDPQFLKPMRLYYTQDGVLRSWEAVQSHNSVAILLYHTQKDAFVIVKQIRPAVLYTDPKDGFMHELCAGIIDKNKSDKMIAKEEILEECGYDVALEHIEKITTFYTSVGFSGAYQTLYYAQVDEDIKKTQGGGLEEESIEVLYIPTKEAKKFLFDETYKKTPGMMAAFFWFFETQPHLHNR
jgi:UDP-sugar diphosphatase